MGALVEAKHVDWNNDCDAPMFRDFQQQSTGSMNSAWFDTHEEYSSLYMPGGVPEAEEAKVDANNSTRTQAGGHAGDAGAKHRDAPSRNGTFADVSNTVRAQAGDAAGDADAKKKKKNIVSSWGNDVEKKRKGDDDASGQRTAKAVKPKEKHEPAAKHKAKVKVQKAARAEARRKGAKEHRQLSVIKVTLKNKGNKPRVTAAPRRIMPMRSTKMLTVPEDVELHTSRRAAAHVKDKVVDHHDDTSDADTEDNKENSPFKPLALRVKEFDKTPGRFKRKADKLPPSRPLTITEPKEPSLVTSARARPSTFKPREVLEADEMAQMPVFRASTLNPLILSTSGQLGVPKVEKREITAPMPFSFVTDDRAEARAARQAKQQEQEQRQKQQSERQTASDNEGRDKAGKLDDKARKGAACHLLEPVVPRSPVLQTKFRARGNKTEEQRFEFHARPVPKFISMISLDLPREPPPAPTQPAPFRLATEERSARYRYMLESKLAEEEKAARRARVPRANGLPLSTDMPLVPPKPEPRALTVPEPFHLESEARHCVYEEQMRRALEEEEAAKRAEAEFKAKPMWKGIPFRLHDADIPLTVPEPVSLRTSVRAVEREEFNKHMEEKMKEAEAVAKQAEEERRLREEEERKQLRKAAVFHARPMPDLSALPAAKPPPPPKPLTKPRSPVLATRKRRKLRKDDDA